MADRKQRRQESKRRKMAALLELTKQSRESKQKAQEAASEPYGEPEKKKFKKITSRASLWDSVQKLVVEDLLQPHQQQQHQQANNDKAKQDLNIIKEEQLEMKRELKRLRKECPRFTLKANGERASIGINLNERVPLFLADIQHLVAYCVLEMMSQYKPDRWCWLERVGRVQHVSLVIVENLGLEDFAGNEAGFPFVASNYSSVQLHVEMPQLKKSSLIHHLSVMPLAEEHKKRLIEEFGSLEAALRSTEDIFAQIETVFPVESSDFGSPAECSFNRTHLLLSPMQMLLEKYPLPLKGHYKQKLGTYLNTRKKYKPVKSTSPLFAVDCEMVHTTISELARITIVNEDEEVVYESLVKPRAEITNYQTCYSGITAEMLANVETRVEDVQADLQRILPSDAILVGHSLNADLHVLHMMHPYVIDTSVIFNLSGRREVKAKLKVLAKEHLSMDIQNQSHCSKEDSIAALRLAKLKLSRSLEFGDEVMRRHLLLHRSAAGKNLFHDIASKKAAVAAPFDLVGEYQRYVSGSSRARGQVECVGAASRSDVAKESVCLLRDRFVVVSHVRLDGQAARAERCATADGLVKDIWLGAPRGTLSVVLFAGSKDDASGACFVRVKTTM